MNRRLLYLAVSLMLVATLVGSSAAMAQEKTKVVIFVGLGTGTAADQIQRQEALAERFNAENPDIDIEFLIVPHEEAETRYLAMLSGGNPPDLVGPHGISTIAQFLDRRNGTPSDIETAGGSNGRF